MVHFPFISLEFQLSLSHPSKISFNFVNIASESIKMHRNFLVALFFFLQIQQHASALIPSKICMVHRSNDAQSQKVSRKASILIAADASSSRDAEEEASTTTSSVKRWILQGLTCNGCVERVRSFVQVHADHFQSLFSLLYPSILIFTVVQGSTITPLSHPPTLLLPSSHPSPPLLPFPGTRRGRYRQPRSPYIRNI